MRIVILKLRALINGISPHNFDNTNHLFVLPGEDINASDIMRSSTRYW